MLARLVLLFVLVPIIELALLLVLAKYTSVIFALVLVVATGAAGIWLVRQQGFRTLRRIQVELSQGRLPTDSLLDAALILVAGTLLLTPGVLTDAVAITILVPASRHLYRRWLIAWFRSRFSIRAAGFAGPAESRDRSQVIDSYVLGPSRDADE